MLYLVSISLFAAFIMPGAQVISTPLVNQITASCLDRCFAAVATAVAVLAPVAIAAGVQERVGTAAAAVARIGPGLACGS